MSEWIPEDDFVNFVIESVESIDISHFSYNRRGTGSAGYHPHVMLTLLIYCYANGVFSSRRIETASYRDIAVRYILCNSHPDHSTIATFRKNNVEAISEAFLTVLELAKELKLLKVGTISVDGTKIKASAGKHRNIRYDRALEIQEQLEIDIEELMAKAEQADSNESELSESLPEEIARRENLAEKITLAKKNIEERNQKRSEKEKADYDTKIKERESKEKTPRGRKPKEPSAEVNPKLCDNLTDSDSRVMKHNKQSELIQGYNAQAAVDADGTMLVLGTYVTNDCNDKEQLLAITSSVNERTGKVLTVLGDAGYGAEEKVKAVEKQGVEVLVSVHLGAFEEKRHYDFRPQKSTEKSKKKKIEKQWVTDMREKLIQPENRAKYRLRQQTVEPVFGIIKQALGFRQFLTRGLENVNNEWNLVTTAYNFKRLFTLKMA